ncbi:hypothetical protein [Candidatus Uabimicrobium amorphum]|uniref:Uncharacterized protein n=1 Tax=Uabimicrobium amorphum TaxID=2596890 RepID=A0A5S9F719_UABAM|nr:hypothetical protein [Candidatus Uabimicrobium amorphum]BBM88202.1 hypothetical protein UABAM_06623 [Candidatus Uabimicrobium amorphum]
MIIVQRIRTEWTKKSRSHPGSVKRNSTPDVCECAHLNEKGQIYLQKIEYLERNDFEPQQTLFVDNAAEITKCGIKLSSTKEKCEVKFVWSWAYVGEPERRSTQVFSLKKQQFGQLIFNGRFGHTSSSGKEWTYEKNVINVYFANDFCNSDFLLDREPDKQFKSLERIR